MQELILTNNEQITMTSVELVDLINKFRIEEGNEKELLHKNFMSSMRKEIGDLENAGINMEDYFVLSTYKDKNNQSRPCYIITNKGIEYLRNISKHDIRAYCYIIDNMNETQTEVVTLPATSTRKELLINQVLLGFFNKEDIKSQYQVLNYRIDYFIPECGLIIEFDEASGHQDKELDDKRMDEIIHYLFEEWKNNPASDSYDVQNITNPYSHFTVIRIKEFEEYIGLNKLFNFLIDDAKVHTRLEYR